VIEVPDPVTAPTPWLIQRVVAFETLQASVEEPPAVMLDGVAVNDAIRGALVGGVVGAPPESELPPHATMSAPAKIGATSGSFRNALVIAIGHSMSGPTMGKLTELTCSLIVGPAGTQSPRSSSPCIAP
jgi:hypothetical protein